MKKNLAGMLGFAAMMAMGDNLSLDGMPRTDGHSYKQKATTMRSTAILTPKQLKERARNKRAKQARKLNRVS